MKNIFLLSVFFLTIVSCTSPITKPKVSFENVRIEKDSKHLYYIVGEIRNYGDSKIKGYIKVEYLNNNLDIIGNAKSKINDGEYINPKQTVEFKIAKSPKELENVIDFNTKFIKN